MGKPSSGDNRTTAYVLDSFALLALAGDEAGAGTVQRYLDEAGAGDVTAVMSVVNLGEACYIVERKRGLIAVHELLANVDQSPLEIVDVGRDDALAAAHVKARYPVAYADAYAIAMAQSREATVLTGDPEFESVQSLVTVEWL